MTASMTSRLPHQKCAPETAHTRLLCYLRYKCTASPAFVLENTSSLRTAHKKASRNEYHWLRMTGRARGIGVYSCQVKTSVVLDKHAGASKRSCGGIEWTGRFLDARVEQLEQLWALNVSVGKTFFECIWLQPLCDPGDIDMGVKVQQARSS